MKPLTTKRKGAAKKAASQRPRSGNHHSWKLRRTGALQVVEAPPLKRQSWLVHGFSTRPGGASELPTLRNGRKETQKILNLGFTNWDSRERVADNRKKFVQALGAGKMRVVALRQVHSDIVHRVDASALSLKEAPQADALVTRERGVLLAVQVADCIPILLADTKNRAVAAIHSGWRGTLRRIVEKTIGRMQMDFGTKAATSSPQSAPESAAVAMKLARTWQRSLNPSFLGRASGSRGRSMRSRRARTIRIGFPG